MRRSQSPSIHYGRLSPSSHQRPMSRGVSLPIPTTSAAVYSTTNPSSNQLFNRASPSSIASAPFMSAALYAESLRAYNDSLQQKYMLSRPSIPSSSQSHHQTQILAHSFYMPRIHGRIQAWDEERYRDLVMGASSYRNSLQGQPTQVIDPVEHTMEQAAAHVAAIEKEVQQNEVENAQLRENLAQAQNQADVPLDYTTQALPPQVENDPVFFQCPLCPKAYSTPNFLQIHISMFHPNIRQDPSESSSSTGSDTETSSSGSEQDGRVPLEEVVELVRQEVDQKVSLQVQAVVGQLVGQLEELKQLSRQTRQQAEKFHAESTTKANSNQVPVEVRLKMEMLEKQLQEMRHQEQQKATMELKQEIQSLASQIKSSSSQPTVRQPNHELPYDPSPAFRNRGAGRVDDQERISPDTNFQKKFKSQTKRTKKRHASVHKKQQKRTSKRHADSSESSSNSSSSSSPSPSPKETPPKISKKVAKKAKEIPHKREETQQPPTLFKERPTSTPTRLSVPASPAAESNISASQLSFNVSEPTPKRKITPSIPQSASYVSDAVMETTELSESMDYVPADDLSTAESLDRIIPTDNKQPNFMIQSSPDALPEESDVQTTKHHQDIRASEKTGDFSIKKQTHSRTKKKVSEKHLQPIGLPLKVMMIGEDIDDDELLAPASPETSTSGSDFLIAPANVRATIERSTPKPPRPRQDLELFHTSSSALQTNPSLPMKNDYLDDIPDVLRDLTASILRKSEAKTPKPKAMEPQESPSSSPPSIASARQSLDSRQKQIWQQKQDPIHPEHHYSHHQQSIQTGMTKDDHIPSRFLKPASDSHAKKDPFSRDALVNESDSGQSHERSQLRRMEMIQKEAHIKGQGIADLDKILGNTDLPPQGHSSISNVAKLTPRNDQSVEYMSQSLKTSKREQVTLRDSATSNRQERNPTDMQAQHTQKLEQELRLLRQLEQERLKFEIRRADRLAEEANRRMQDEISRRIDDELRKRMHEQELQTRERQAEKERILQLEIKLKQAEELLRGSSFAGLNPQNIPPSHIQSFWAHPSGLTRDSSHQDPTLQSHVVSHPQPTSFLQDYGTKQFPQSHTETPSIPGHQSSVRHHDGNKIQEATSSEVTITAANHQGHSDFKQRADTKKMISADSWAGDVPETLKEPLHRKPEASSDLKADQAKHNESIKKSNIQVERHEPQPTVVSTLNGNDIHDKGKEHMKSEPKLKEPLPLSQSLPQFSIQASQDSDEDSLESEDALPKNLRQSLKGITSTPTTAKASALNVNSFSSQNDVIVKGMTTNSAKRTPPQPLTIPSPGGHVTFDSDDEFDHTPETNQKGKDFKGSPSLNTPTNASPALKPLERLDSSKVEPMSSNKALKSVARTPTTPILNFLESTKKDEFDDSSDSAEFDNDISTKGAERRNSMRETPISIYAKPPIGSSKPPSAVPSPAPSMREGFGNLGGSLGKKDAVMPSTEVGKSDLRTELLKKPKPNFTNLAFPRQLEEDKEFTSSEDEKPNIPSPQSVSSSTRNSLTTVSIQDGVLRRSGATSTPRGKMDFSQALGISTPRVPLKEASSSDDDDEIPARLSQRETNSHPTTATSALQRKDSSSSIIKSEGPQNKPDAQVERKPSKTNIHSMDTNLSSTSKAVRPDTPTDSESETDSDEQPPRKANVSSQRQTNLTSSASKGHDGKAIGKQPTSMYPSDSDSDSESESESDNEASSTSEDESHRKGNSRRKKPTTETNRRGKTSDQKPKKQTSSRKGKKGKSKQKSRTDSTDESTESSNESVELDVHDNSNIHKEGQGNESTNQKPVGQTSIGSIPRLGPGATQQTHAPTASTSNQGATQVHENESRSGSIEPKKGKGGMFGLFGKGKKSEDSKTPGNKNQKSADGPQPMPTSSSTNKDTSVTRNDATPQTASNKKDDEKKLKTSFSFFRKGAKDAPRKGNDSTFEQPTTMERTTPAHVNQPQNPTSAQAPHKAETPQVSDSSESSSEVDEPTPEKPKQPEKTPQNKGNGIRRLLSEPPNPPSAKLREKILKPVLFRIEKLLREYDGRFSKFYAGIEVDLGYDIEKCLDPSALTPIESIGELGIEACCRIVMRVMKMSRDFFEDELYEMLEKLPISEISSEVFLDTIEDQDTRKLWELIIRHCNRLKLNEALDQTKTFHVFGLDPKLDMKLGQFIYAMVEALD